jgi:hypothetical protein
MRGKGDSQGKFYLSKLIVLLPYFIFTFPLDCLTVSVSGLYTKGADKSLVL